MTSTNTKSGALLVRQVKSGIGFNKDQKATLRALGLGKIGQHVVNHADAAFGIKGGGSRGGFTDRGLGHGGLEVTVG